MADMVTLTTIVSQELADKVRAAADEDGRSISNWLREQLKCIFTVDEELSDADDD